MTNLSKESPGAGASLAGRNQWPGLPGFRAQTLAYGEAVQQLGDLMMRWTNGRYASNLHRVRNDNVAADRYSLAFFYSPHSEAVIEPIPSCVEANRPRRFETCTADEYVREMFRRSYGY